MSKRRIMSSLVIEHPQKLVNALADNRKMAVFAIDDEKKPLFLLSDILYQNCTDFAKIPPILEPAVKYIRHNYNKDIKLPEVSSISDISYCYFSRLFSEAFGMGFNEYVIRLRLDHAKLLLSSTNRSAVSIAMEVGYSDCNYFNKIFKKKEGCSPLQWRKTHPLLP